MIRRGFLLFSLLLSMWTAGSHSQILFSPAERWVSFPERFTRIHSADLNGDGQEEFVALSQNGYLYLGIRDPDGTYNFRLFYNRPVSASSENAGLFFNNMIGDEQRDLVVVSSQQKLMHVFENRGNGLFADPVPISFTDYFRLSDQSHFLTMADLNGSGLPDLIFQDVQQDSVYRVYLVLYENNGLLSFTAKDTLKSLYASMAAAGDFNRDLSLDFVLFSLGRNPDSAFVYLNTGDFHFILDSSYAMGSYPTDVEIADVDQDGYPDILAGYYETMGEFSAFSYLLNRGDGRFSGPFSQKISGKGVFSLCSGDLDGDGYPEVVLTSDSVQVQVLKNNGDGTFTAPDAYIWLGFPIFQYRNLICRDENQDGYMDVLGNGGDGLFLLTGDGSGALDAAPEYPLPLNRLATATMARDSLQLLALDLNQDELLDLAAASRNTRGLALLYGTPEGGFEEPVDFFPLDYPAYLLRRGDMNSDGWFDILLADSTARRLRIFVSTGGALPQLLSTVELPDPLVDFATADFDSDGIFDLAVLYRLRKEIQILAGNGQGNFTLLQTVALRDTGAALLAADFNRDGHADLAVGFTQSPMDLPAIAIYLGEGDGTFLSGYGTGTGSMPPIPTGLLNLRTSDFDGNGVPDILFQGFIGYGLFINDGSGNMTHQSIDLGSETIIELAISDFTGDGIPDVAVQDNMARNRISVFSGNGDATFRKSDFSYMVSGLPAPLHAGDFNGDGHADLAVLTAPLPSVAILFGQKGVEIDGSILAILAPQGTVQVGESITPSALVKNSGFYTETGLVRFAIGPNYRDSLSVQLNPGEERTVSFRKWAPQTAGIYTVRAEIVISGDQVSANDTMTSTVRVESPGAVPPLVRYLRPDRGGNTGMVEVRIFGDHFEPGAHVLLKRAGYPDIRADSLHFLKTYVANSSEIVAVFNLEGAATGWWDLEIANPGGTSVLQKNAFFIEEGRAELWVDILGHSRIRFRKPIYFDLLIGNSGNICLNYVIPLLTLPPEWQLDSLEYVAENRKLLDGDSLRQANVPLDSIYLFIRNLRPGQVVRFRMYGKGIVAVSKLLEKTGAELPKFGLSGAVLNSLECLAKNAVRIQIYKPENREEAWNDAFHKAGEKFAVSLLGDVVKIGLALIAPELVLAYEVFAVVSTLISAAKDVGQFTGYAWLRKLLGITISMDPNYKDGPSGYGKEGYVQKLRPFYYTIHFENLDSATAAAENIVIIDTLDSNLDWNTLSFQNASHPGLQFEFDSTAGILRASYEGINLPPNKNPPEGEGWIQFVVWPKRELATGAQIANRASIYFDYNDPIVTPTVLNTIDISPPSSYLNPLDPIQQHVSFPVSWSGTDEGSGVASYRVYVAENDGDYVLWTQTIANEAVFIGKNGHRYAFYVQAVDYVGNAEPVKQEAEATVQIRAKEEIGVNPNPFVPARGDDRITFFGGSLGGGQLNIYTVSGQRVTTLYVPPEEIRFSWDVKNEKGEPLASGVYIWRLKTREGTFYGKFAVIR